MFLFFTLFCTTTASEAGEFRIRALDVVTQNAINSLLPLTAFTQFTTKKKNVVCFGNGTGVDQRSGPRNK
jgi:hypothetical protein